MVRINPRQVRLIELADATASDTGETFSGFGDHHKLIGQVVCSSLTGTSPKADAKIQHSLDGGTTWFDLITFTQLTDEGSEAKTYSETDASASRAFGPDLRAVVTLSGTVTDCDLTVDVYAKA